MATRFCLGVAALILAGCALVPAGSPQQTWLMVLGRMDWRASQNLSLEIHDQAWSIRAGQGHGVVTADLSESSDVRLVGVSDCHVYAAFRVDPGSAHIIRFGADGTATVENLGDDAGREMGPAINEGTPSDC